jgi:hypothetical protein
MADIVDVPNEEQAASAILSCLGSHKMVRIEGFCGAGKTRVAGWLAKLAGAAHIGTDAFRKLGRRANAVVS